MKSIYMAALLGLVALSQANANAGTEALKLGGHPIEKVIALVEELKGKSIAEGKKDAVAYSKFTYWCKTSIDTLDDAISDEKEAIAELEDLLAGKNKEKDTLEKEIGTLEEEIKDREASAAAAKALRKKEAGIYDSTLSDVKGTIKAVNGALKALSSAEGKTEGGASFAQRQVKEALSLISLRSSVTQAEVRGLQAFAKGRPDQLAKGDLDAHEDKYDFKSENVIELLKNLKLKFQDEKLAVTKAETNALNAYDLAKRAQDNAIKAANKSKDKKTKTLGAVKLTIKNADNSLADENANKKADSKTRSDTKSECATKKSQYEERSTTRENEIAAMDTAKEILGKATGVRTEAPGNPIPPASPAMFLQIQADNNPKKMSAVSMIRGVAQSTHSKALERLATEVQAHLSGPFDQVNNMIEKMIFRLMDEQRQEDEHKHWCDQEIKKTDVMKEDKEDKVADLKAEIKSETAAVGELTEQIKSAAAMIAKITTFKKEATEIRETGKHENKLAIKDSETAQKALANAIAVLTDFYKSSGEIAKEPWEFIQAPGVKLPKNPKTWGSEYTGVSDPDKQPGGIITVLEKVMSDFAKMEGETRAQEVTDQEEYDQSMSDNDIEKARREQESDMKSGEKARRIDDIAMLESQKKTTSDELEKTNQYLTDLQPACTSGKVSYKDRKGARDQEIEALKKAQVILQDAFKEKKSSSFLQIHSA